MTECKLWNITCVNLLSFTAIRLQKWSDNKGTLKFFISFNETWNICGLTAYEASTTNCVGLKMSGWTLIYRVAISFLRTHFLTNAKVLIGTWLRHSVANTIYIWVHRTHWKQKWWFVVTEWLATTLCFDLGRSRCFFKPQKAATT